MSSTIAPTLETVSNAYMEALSSQTHTGGAEGTGDGGRASDGGFSGPQSPKLGAS